MKVFNRISALDRNVVKVEVHDSKDMLFVGSRRVDEVNRLIRLVADIRNAFVGINALTLSGLWT